jgi:hypothetical protein
MFNLPEIPKLYETTKRWKWRQLAAFVVLALVLVLSVVIPEKSKPLVPEKPPQNLGSFTNNSRNLNFTSEKVQSNGYDFSNFLM